MAAAPSYKIYRHDEYLAAVKYLDHAAMVVAALGTHAEVRYGHTRHQVLWHEGIEDFSAAESYDRAAAVMGDRRDAYIRLAAMHHSQ